MYFVDFVRCLSMIGDGLILDGCPNALVSEERYFRHFFDFRTKDVKLQGVSWEGWLDLGLDKAGLQIVRTASILPDLLPLKAAGGKSIIVNTGSELCLCVCTPLTKLPPIHLPFLA